MMFWHDKVGQERLNRLIAYQFGKFLYETVRTKISQEIKLCLARPVSTTVGQVDDLTLGWPINCTVRRIDETGHAFGMPMVAPGLPFVAIHALLHDGPLAIIRDKESVEVEIEAVLDRGAVDLRTRRLARVKASPSKPTRWPISVSS